MSVPRPWITVTSRHSAIGGGGFLYLPFCLCLCSCGVRLCVFVFVGIQFSVLAALNVSELSCSPSFLPLFSFFRRLLQSPIAYGFQISDVFFFGFSCVSVACGFACISLLATLEYFFSIEFSYYIVHNVIVFCSMRAWFVLILFLRWKGAQFKNHHHHHRFGFECSFNKVVSKYFELP